MISAKLRAALGATALFVIIGGPILAVLGLLGALLYGGDSAGVATGGAIRFFFGSIIAGGILRLLISIDARLEARN